MIYPTTYKSKDAAIEAIRIKWWKYLEDDFEVNGEPATEQWKRTVDQSRIEKNITYLYIEKGIHLEIHHLESNLDLEI